VKKETLVEKRKLYQVIIENQTIFSEKIIIIKSATRKKFFAIPKLKVKIAKVGNNNRDKINNSFPNKVLKKFKKRGCKVKCLIVSGSRNDLQIRKKKNKNKNTNNNETAAIDNPKNPPNNLKQLAVCKVKIRPNPSTNNPLNP
jgi:hypothetical protein